MAPTDEGCVRLARLLGEADEAAARAPGEDPLARLRTDDLEWAAAHLDRCTVCSLRDDAAVGALLAALRSTNAAPLPDDTFFAGQRGAIMDVVRAEGAAGGRTVAATLPTRRIPLAWPANRVGRTAAGLALAAGVVLALAAVLVSQRLRVDERVVRVAAPEASQVAAIPREPRTGRPDAAAGTADRTAEPSRDPAALAASEDAWLVASSGFLAVERPGPNERSLRSLSDDELDEIEGVFLSDPGWS